MPRDVLRRRVARPRDEHGYAEFVALVGEQAAVRECEAFWLREALGRLSDEVRVTVFLVLEGGLRHAEAGEVLGVSEAMVSWPMHEVRKRLRVLAAGEEEVRRATSSQGLIPRCVRLRRGRRLRSASGSFPRRWRRSNATTR